MGVDAIVDIRWGQRDCRYVVECKRDSKPQTLRAAVGQAKRYAEMNPGTRPMVMVPYLSDQKLDDLSTQGVSGIDLCGNGIVEGPSFSFARTGHPNLYPDSANTRSAYRGSASMVARAMLLREQFDAVGDVLAFIEDAGGKLVMSTVSKALKPLEEDLVIDRKSGPAVRVTDRAKILDELAKNYRPPNSDDDWAGRVDLPNDVLQQRLIDVSASRALVQTGMRSAPNYVTFAGAPRSSCTRRHRLLTSSVTWTRSLPRRVHSRT